MNEFNYHSPLQGFIEGMIREKQSLGYKYDSSARTLYQFDQFCLSYGCVDAAITKKLVFAWIQRKPNESLATLQIRASVVRQLALYMLPGLASRLMCCLRTPCQRRLDIRLTFLATRK